MIAKWMKSIKIREFNTNNGMQRNNMVIRQNKFNGNEAVVGDVGCGIK